MNKKREGELYTMEKNTYKKPVQVGVRLSEEQYNDFKEMANKSGRSLADFIRIATMKYIEIIKDTNQL